MTLDDVQELKQELLAPIQKKIQDRAATAESSEPLRSNARMAVGYSPHKTGLHLEIRVEKKTGPASRTAEKIKARYPKEINVLVLESAVEVPPSKAVLEHKPHSNRLIDLANTNNPLCLGASVSHRDAISAGSLGAFVVDEENEVAILSCSHVLALSGAAKKGKDNPVVHPGQGDVDQLTNENLIGQLKGYTILSRGKANSLDAAYAYLDEDVAYLGNTIPDGVGAPSDAEGKRIGYDVDLELGADTELAKIGRTTGYTEGILNAIGVDNVSVHVPGIGLVYFDNCLEVRWKAVNQPFTRPGDSGATVITAQDRMAIGVHFAATEAQRDGRRFKLSYACELPSIMTRFKLSW